MKKSVAGFVAVLWHNHVFAAAATATASSVTAHFLTSLLGLRPEIWACATFGAAYAYMLRKDAPRNRIFNVIFSIFIGVFGSDAAASYLTNAHKIESVFLTPLLALIVAAAFPWLFEKYIVKRK